MSPNNDLNDDTQGATPTLPAIQKSHSRKHFSIDLSLELERQLNDIESPPATPHGPVIPNDSLDPSVLAHIIMQLRQSLTRVTKERDDVVNLLANAHAQEASAKDALQVVTDKATELEDELGEARKKLKDDEEAIALLRAKVEESRRGLMRLQTESRRHSGMSIDTQRSLQAFGSPPTAKSASFTPFTGMYSGRPSSHRRISSISDSHVGAISAQISNPNPNEQVVTIPVPPPSTVSNQPATATATATAAPFRFSLFGRSGPQPSTEQQSTETLAADVESLRKELGMVKAELAASRHEVAEAHEAQEAAEMCLKALRQFISDNPSDISEVQSTSVSPLISPGTPGTEGAKGSQARWRLNLWKTNAGSASSGDGLSPLPVKKSKMLSSSPNSAQSSTLPKLHRESLYSLSDSSSLAEPISPKDDIDGLGTGPAYVLGSMTSYDGTGAAEDKIPKIPITSEGHEARVVIA